MIQSVLFFVIGKTLNMGVMYYVLLGIYFVSWAITVTNKVMEMKN